MWTPDRYPRGRRFGLPRVAVFSFAVSLAALLPSLLLAAPRPQPSPADTAPASAAERRALRQTIEQSYEVLPISDGVLLRPKAPRAGVKSIEIKGSDIAINGATLPTRAVRDWLGDSAEPLLRLQRLKPADRLQLLGIDRPQAKLDTLKGLPAKPSGDALPGKPGGEKAERLETPEAPEAPEPPEAAETGDKPEPPAEAAEAESSDSGNHYTGDRMNIGGGVTVAKGERAEQVVAIGGPAHVEGEVDQGVVSVGGSVYIDGKVGGDVVSVGGGVWLKPNAVIDGDVTSVGGTIHREAGAQIHGNTSEVGLFPWLERWDSDGHGRHWRNSWKGDWGPFAWFGGFGDFLGSLTWFILTCLLVCLVILVARQPLERAYRQLTAQPWLSAGVGVLSALAFWPLFIIVTVLLVITIVGCLLIALYPFFFLFLALWLLLGYATVALRIGRLFEERFQINFGGPYLAAIMGVFLIQVTAILGSLFSWMGGPGHFLAAMLGFFGFLVKLAALMVGFGAVVLARFGTAPGYWPRRGAPGIPVVPAVPPESTVNPAPGELPLTHSEPPLYGEENPPKVD
jgi:hypothetical protein